MTWLPGNNSYGKDNDRRRSGLQNTGNENAALIPMISLWSKQNIAVQHRTNGGVVLRYDAPCHKVPFEIPLHDVAGHQHNSGITKR